MRTWICSPALARLFSNAENRKSLRRTESDDDLYDQLIGYVRKPRCMKLVIISGRSGSGKSTALRALEDAGFNSIDNFPVKLLPSLVEDTLADPICVRRDTTLCASMPAARTWIRSRNSLLPSTGKQNQFSDHLFWTLSPERWSNGSAKPAAVTR